MIRTVTRRRALGAVLVAAVSFLVSLGSPAYASEPEEHCILLADDGTVVCAATIEAADAAFHDATGYTRVEDEAARGVLAVYSLATLYQDSGYGGSSYTITRTSSCNGVTVSGLASLAATGLDNAVSSYLAYGSCQVRLYSDASYGGSTFGYAGSQSSLPSFNDLASSVRVR